MPCLGRPLVRGRSLRAIAMLAAELSQESRLALYPAPHPAPPRILIADDEPFIRELLSRRLTAAGYQCDSAGDGRTASQMLEACPYDLLLTDIMMPGLGGLDLLAEACRTRPDTAVILVTSVLDVGIAVDALKQGACDYITKPFDLDHVLDSIGRALDKRRSIVESRVHQHALEVEVARRTRQLRDALEVIQQNYHSMLVALGTALDSRESDSAGHSLRVARYASRLGGQMGLNQAQLRVLEQAAVLHDIGKLGVPEAVLRKKGKLTPEEMAAVRCHPTIGYRILSGIKYLREAALLILHQQERHDGTGYPSGLQGDQITPGARIFAVAHTLDTLTSERPYRPAKSFEEAWVEIANSAGTQLNPSAVEAFLQIEVEEWAEIRRSIENTIRAGNAARRSVLSGPGHDHKRGSPLPPAGSMGEPPTVRESPSPSSWRNLSLGGFI